MDRQDACELQQAGRAVRRRWACAPVQRAHLPPLESISKTGIELLVDVQGIWGSITKIIGTKGAYKIQEKADAGIYISPKVPGLRPSGLRIV